MDKQNYKKQNFQIMGRHDCWSKLKRIWLSDFKNFVFVIFIAYSLPYIALAAPKNFKDLVENILLPIIDQGTKLLVAIAVLIFFWNIATNLWGEQSTEKNKKLKETMVWGIIIIFIMTSIWGILRILRITLLQGI